MKNVPRNVWRHSPECLAAFRGMFYDIPRNVWRHSPEYNIPPIPRIPFPVPVFLFLYIADRIYFYSVFTTHMTSICEKKVDKYLCRISSSYRSSHRRCSGKKVFLKIFAIFTGKNVCWNLFAGLQVCNFMKKRLQH